MTTSAGTLPSGAGPAAVTHTDDTVADPAWQQLPAATLRAWHVDNLLGLLLWLALLGLLAALGRPQLAQLLLLPLAGLGVMAAAVESALVLPRRHRSYRYAASTGSVVVESGVMVRHQLVVPLHQVLYVETHQGPVLRAYGLTRVRLGTIADPKSVGPLTRDAARAMCAAIEASRPASVQQENPQ